MTQKQINELREDFNKHQSETNNTIKRERYELNITTQIHKRGIEQRYRKLQKKESNRTPGNEKSL
jgi:hypothetical protein